MSSAAEWCSAGANVLVAAVAVAAPYAQHRLSRIRQETAELDQHRSALREAVKQLGCRANEGIVLERRTEDGPANIPDAVIPTLTMLRSKHYGYVANRAVYAAWHQNIVQAIDRVLRRRWDAPVGCPEPLLSTYDFIEPLLRAIEAEPSKRRRKKVPRATAAHCPEFVSSGAAGSATQPSSPAPHDGPSAESKNPSHQQTDATSDPQQNADAAPATPNHDATHGDAD